MMLSERLKKLGKENNMTQTGLVKELGILGGTIAILESDIKKPSFERLEECFKYLINKVVILWEYPMFRLQMI